MANFGDLQNEIYLAGLPLASDLVRGNRTGFEQWGLVPRMLRASTNGTCRSRETAATQEEA